MYEKLFAVSDHEGNIHWNYMRYSLLWVTCLLFKSSNRPWWCVGERMHSWWESIVQPLCQCRTACKARKKQCKFSNAMTAYIAKGKEIRISDTDQHAYCYCRTSRESQISDPPNTQQWAKKIMVYRQSLPNTMRSVGREGWGEIGQWMQSYN